MSHRQISAPSTQHIRSKYMCASWQGVKGVGTSEQEENSHHTGWTSASQPIEIITILWMTSAELILPDHPAHIVLTISEPPLLVSPPMDTAAEWPDFLVRRMRTKDFLGPIKRPTTDIHCNWSRLIFCWCYWCFSEAHHMHLTLVRLSKKNWKIAPSHALKDERITSTKSEVGNISILAQRHPCDIRLGCWASNSNLYQTRTNIMTLKLLK